MWNRQLEDTEHKRRRVKLIREGYTHSEVDSIFETEELWENEYIAQKQQEQETEQKEQQLTEKQEELSTREQGLIEKEKSVSQKLFGVESMEKDLRKQLDQNTESLQKEKTRLQRDYNEKLKTASEREFEELKAKINKSFEELYQKQLSEIQKSREQLRLDLLEVHQNWVDLFDELNRVISKNHDVIYVFQKRGNGMVDVSRLVSASKLKKIVYTDVDNDESTLDL